jgi:hypothetical protein
VLVVTGFRGQFELSGEGDSSVKFDYVAALRSIQFVLKIISVVHFPGLAARRGISERSADINLGQCSRPIERRRWRRTLRRKHSTTRHCNTEEDEDKEISGARVATHQTDAILTQQLGHLERETSPAECTRCCTSRHTRAASI